MTLLAAAALSAGLLSAPAAAQPRPAQPPPAAAPQPAQDQPKPLAEALTGDAKRAYEEGKLAFANDAPDKALIKFQQAFELSKDPRLLWNMALCYRGLRRFAKMHEMLKRYLAEGGSLITAQDRADATAAIEAAEAFISPLRISVSEPGATVIVDGEEVGTSPIGPQSVDVGSHTVVVRKPGFREVVQEVVLKEKAGKDVVVRLVPDVHQGRLIVTAGPDDVIHLDGKWVGRGRWEGVVKSGGHTLRVTAPDMVPYQSEVVVKDDEVRRVPVTLSAKPSGEVARWLWIAGGTLLVTGAVVGGALLFQPSNRTVPGTIDPGLIELSFGGRK